MINYFVAVTNLKIPAPKQAKTAQAKSPALLD
jgi:hypothetical protein